MTTICQTSHEGFVIDCGLVTTIINGINSQDSILYKPTYIWMMNGGTPWQQGDDSIIWCWPSLQYDEHSCALPQSSSSPQQFSPSMFLQCHILWADILWRHCHAPNKGQWNHQHPSICWDFSCSVFSSFSSHSVPALYHWFLPSHQWVFMFHLPWHLLCFPVLSLQWSFLPLTFSLVSLVVVIFQSHLSCHHCPSLSSVTSLSSFSLLYCLVVVFVSSLLQQCHLSLSFPSLSLYLLSLYHLSVVIIVFVSPLSYSLSLSLLFICCCHLCHSSLSLVFVVFVSPLSLLYLYLLSLYHLSVIVIVFVSPLSYSLSLSLLSLCCYHLCHSSLSLLYLLSLSLLSLCTHCLCLSSLIFGVFVSPLLYSLPVYVLSLCCHCLCLSSIS